MGNLYYLDDWPGCWRAFSPPGANQATTVALPIVQVIASVQAPYITSIGVSGGTVTIHFTGGSSDVAWAFVLLSAPAAAGPYSPAAGAVITGSGGSFQATVPVNGPRQFYRIRAVGHHPAPYHEPEGRRRNGDDQLHRLPERFPFGVYAVKLSRRQWNLFHCCRRKHHPDRPGVFQATVPTNGPRQFYRIGK